MKNYRDIFRACAVILPIFALICAGVFLVLHGLWAFVVSFVGTALFCLLIVWIEA